MNDLLNFLIEAINTVDGNRDSANKVYNAIRDEKIKGELEKKTKMSSAKKKTWMSNPQVQRKYAPKPIERLSVMKTTSFRYKLLRIRSKLGFEAFRQKKTVQELLLSQIMASYSDLT